MLMTGMMATAASAQEVENPAPTKEEAIEFYISKVKPILKENCFECHGGDPHDIKGSLVLTSRDSILRGGDSGPAVDLKSHDESIFLKVINYDVYEMPPKGKLADDKIKILTDWVKLGLPFSPEDENDIVDRSESKVA